MSVEEQDVNEERQPKKDCKRTIDGKEIFLVKAFRCAFKLMDRSQRIPLSHITKTKKLKTKMKRGS